MVFMVIMVSTGLVPIQYILGKQFITKLSSLHIKNPTSLQMVQTFDNQTVFNHSKTGLFCYSDVKKLREAQKYLHQSPKSQGDGRPLDNVINRCPVYRNIECCIG
jgi:hypothetical protein